MDIDLNVTKGNRSQRHKESQQKAIDWVIERKNRKSRKQINLFASWGSEPIQEAKVLTMYAVGVWKGNLCKDIITAIYIRSLNR